MTQTIETKIQFLDNYLRLDRKNKNTNHENEIEELYLHILGLLSRDYLSYRKYFPVLLESLENNDAHLYSFSLFFQLYDGLINPNNIERIDDLDQFNEVIANETSKKLFDQLKQCLGYQSNIRISDFAYDCENFNDREKRECISC